MVIPQKTGIAPEVKVLTDSAFMRSCRLLKTSYTPIWVMRQAGRYLPEYRAVRSKLSFLELCKRPEAAAEVTVLAVEKLGVDAAIIFADILLLLDALGAGLEFSDADGPIIRNPVKTVEDVAKLKPVNPNSALAYVFEAMALTRNALKPNIPLIGFAGAPFTLASYLIEGGSSRNFIKTKQFMYGNPEAWHQLMLKLSQLTISYLNGQIRAGAQAIQLFDSWVGCLSVDDYKDYVLPHVRKIIAGIADSVPVIYFGTGTAALLADMKTTGAQVLGLDWRVDLAHEWSELSFEVAIQGNLDPVVLLASQDEILKRVKKILAGVNGRPGHIFNLGHGVLPQTPVDNVRFLVEIVHNLSAR